ncbi:hypothetical protein [Corynebacterium sp. HMSC30G07]|uniref:hypothetical protein n=1 Tax=Corynebacterium sp. HMSC30G07 TaxID=1581072 RepID=UPI00114D0726|nr:hypothetical protein [Corynebacterium sp. HMSC30G07]
MQQKTVALAVASAMMAAAVPTVATAPAAHADTGIEAVTVRQGDRIRVGESSQCTLGYIEQSPSGPAGYTAGHCGKNRTEKVYVQSGDQWVLVGATVRSGKYNPKHTGSDWALILFNRGVRLEGNPLSGDARTDIDELKSGDKICFAGATTQTTRCGDFIGTIGGNIYWENTGARPGDSGAPVWREGGGFLGVLAGQNIVSASEQDQLVALRASITEDAEAPSSDEEMRKIAGFYEKDGTNAISVKTPVVVPKGGASTPAGNTTGGSSNPETIAMVLIAITAVLGLALPAFAQAANIQLPF